MLAASALLRGWRPGPDPAADIRTEHRLLTSTRSARDRMQVPWPRRLGTPPWAIANALWVLTDRQVATVNVRPRPAVGFEVLREQVQRRPTAVYIGDRWLPRHVVLAFADTDHGIRLFDPSHGDLATVPRERWTHHRVGVAGWSHAWFVL